MLIENINDEQLLEILLENQSYRDYDLEGFSGELITLYCMQRVGIGAPFEDVYSDVQELISDHVCATLVKDGLLEVQFNDTGVDYIPTADGLALKKMYEEINKEQ
jgi:hypothetical protein